DVNIIAEKKDVAPVKKEVPVVTKTVPAQTAVPQATKQTPPAAKETTEVAKAETEKTVLPAVKETPKVAEEPVKVPVPETVQKTEPTPVPQPVKETAPAATIEKTDTEYTTLSDGNRIKKPVEKASGGGKTTSASAPETISEKTVVEEVKESKPTPAPVPVKSPEAKPSPPAVIKTPATESKPAPATVKTEVTSTTVTKTTETKSTETIQPVVKSNRHPLVPLSKPETGIIFKIQLFSLKGELKEYDKFMKLFTVLTAEELNNGVTRYYGAKTKSLAEAKRYHAIAVANGYKDSYIVGFKDGNRMSFEELKAAEDK
ncbi:MAG: hypothetical protein V4615_11995, partial [Bacteroidota bacterium]